MAFSQNLKYLKKKNNFTAEQLADELGVTLKTVAEWESGKAMPDDELLSAICAMFDVTLDELVHGNIAEDKTDGKSAKNNCRKGAVIDCVLIAAAAIIYLILGFAAKLWHPGWIIFIFALAACSFIHAFSCGSLRGAQASGELGCGVMLTAVAVYLVLGFVAKLWHPGWIIFIAAVVLDCLIGYILNKK